MSIDERQLTEDMVNQRLRRLEQERAGLRALLREMRDAFGAATAQRDAAIRGRDEAVAAERARIVELLRDTAARLDALAREHGANHEYNAAIALGDAADAIEREGRTP